MKAKLILSLLLAFTVNAFSQQLELSSVFETQNGVGFSSRGPEFQFSYQDYSWRVTSSISQNYYDLKTKVLCEDRELKTWTKSSNFLELGFSAEYLFHYKKFSLNPHLGMNFPISFRSEGAYFQSGVTLEYVIERKKPLRYGVQHSDGEYKKWTMSERWRVFVSSSKLFSSKEETVFNGTKFTAGIRYLFW